eukprot:1029721-Prymnesium_polylepis.1
MGSRHGGRAATQAARRASLVLTGGGTRRQCYVQRPHGITRLRPGIWSIRVSERAPSNYGLNAP